MSNILPQNAALKPQVMASLRNIHPRVEAAQKKETDEMMGKLKDLGNTVLGKPQNRYPLYIDCWLIILRAGKFGMSTDNFQFTPNGAGGYSMNFVR